MHKWNPQLSKLIPQFDSHRWQAADLDFSVDPRMSQDDFFFGSTLRNFDLWVDWVWSGAISRGVRAAPAAPWPTVSALLLPLVLREPLGAQSGALCRYRPASPRVPADA